MVSFARAEDVVQVSKRSVPVSRYSSSICLSPTPRAVGLGGAVRGKVGTARLGEVVKVGKVGVGQSC